MLDTRASSVRSTRTISGTPATRRSGLGVMSPPSLRREPKPAASTIALVTRAAWIGRNWWPSSYASAIACTGQTGQILFLSRIYTLISVSQPAHSVAKSQQQRDGGCQSVRRAERPATNGNTADSRHLPIHEHPPVGGCHSCVTVYAPEGVNSRRARFEILESVDLGPAKSGDVRGLCL